MPKSSNTQSKSKKEKRPSAGNSSTTTRKKSSSKRGPNRTMKTLKKAKQSEGLPTKSIICDANSALDVSFIENDGSVTRGSEHNKLVADIVDTLRSMEEGQQIVLNIKKNKTDEGATICTSSMSSTSTADSRYVDDVGLERNEEGAPTQTNCIWLVACIMGGLLGFVTLFVVVAFVRKAMEGNDEDDILDSGFVTRYKHVILD